MALIDEFLNAEPALSRSEVLARPCPIVAGPGVYGWWFDEIPPGVPVEGCSRRGAETLLYVGISPKAPPRNGRAPSSQTVRSRVVYHYRGNAEGSTLRLSLGVVLAERLGLELRRVGSGKRMTFACGEALLSEWMAKHARVRVLQTPKPWVAEELLIEQLVLPLNLDGSRHPFRRELSSLRSHARERARTLPILTE